MKNDVSYLNTRSKLSVIYYININSILVYHYNDNLFEISNEFYRN